MKKILLFAIGVMFCSVVHANENGPLEMYKSNGEKIVSIKGGVLNVAGFDITLKENENPGAEEMDSRGYSFDDELCRCGCGRKGCMCGKAQHTNVTTIMTSSHPSVRRSTGTVKVIVPAKKKATSVTCNFDFGLLGFDGDPGEMKLNHQKSVYIGLDLRRNHALNPARTVWFSMGGRLRWNNYAFDNRITLERDNGQIVPVPLDMGRRFKKSKLSTFSIDVPVAFHFRIARAIRLETGAYGGMTVGDRTKVKFPKEKDKGDWMTNFWQAGATVRLKVAPLPFGVFGTYSFVPLFEHGAGPKLNPFMLGIYF